MLSNEREGGLLLHAIDCCAQLCRRSLLLYRRIVIVRSLWFLCAAHSVPCPPCESQLQ